MIELILASQLAASQPNLPNLEQHLQKPPIIYAQFSEEFDYYRNLAFKRGSSSSDIKEALDFYNFMIDERKDSPRLAEAYLYSGRLIICCLKEYKDINEGIARLKQAYELANDKRIKAEALFTLGIVEKDYSNAGYKNFSLKNAKGYFQEIIKLLPGSELAKESKRILRKPEFKKIK